MKLRTLFIKRKCLSHRNSAVQQWQQFLPHAPGLARLHIRIGQVYRGVSAIILKCCVDNHEYLGVVIPNIAYCTGLEAGYAF